MLIASFLNNESASRNPPKHSTPIVLKTAKEQPKVKKRVKRKQKKLKNIKQAPRVSPNFAITMDIPLEMPQVQDMHAELIEQAVEVVPPAPKADNPPPEYPQDARADGIQGRNAPFPVIGYLTIAGTIIWVLGYILVIGIWGVRF